MNQKTVISKTILLGVLINLSILSCNNTVANESGLPNDNISSNVNSTQNYDGNFKEMNDLSLNPVEYVNWIENTDNANIIRVKKISEINYEAKYLPLEFMVSNELKKTAITVEEFNEHSEDYSGMYYFEIKISVDEFNGELAKYGISNMYQYQDRIQYLSFLMQNDLELILDKQMTVACKLYHFERTFGVAPHAKCILGFSKEDIEKLKPNFKNLTLVFNDNLFNKGLLKFNWNVSQLENTPKISVL